MDNKPPRLSSIDIVRGVVMILMALDHVRVYAAVPPGSGDPGVYLTRWITHFCAPAFVFLAGAAAFLHGRRLETPGQPARWLLLRGALLILFELTVSRLGWTFNLDFWNYTEANVIWATGWSMIVLAAMVRLPVAAIGAIGLAIIAGHHLVEGFAPDPWNMPADQSLGWLWQVMYVGGEFRVAGTGPKIVILYTLVPWIGVLAAGYGFGAVMAKPAETRRRRVLTIGLAGIAVFLLLRGFNLYGDPRPWSSTDEELSPVQSFFWTTKYPASLLFLLMTLGPVITLLPALERARGRMTDIISTFGRAPLFYYLLHIPLIHLVAVLISLVRSPDATPWLFLNHPLRIPPAPDGYMYSLPLLYAVWLFAVTLLYFPTRWYANYKAAHPGGWRSYL